MYFPDPTFFNFFLNGVHLEVLIVPQRGRRASGGGYSWSFMVNLHLAGVC